MFLYFYESNYIVSSTRDLKVSPVTETTPVTETNTIDEYGNWIKIENPNGTIVLSCNDLYLNTAGENHLELAPYDPLYTLCFREMENNTFSVTERNDDYSLCIDFSKKDEKMMLMIYPNRVLYNDPMFKVHVVPFVYN
jgi:hypothetical protein